MKLLKTEDGYIPVERIVRIHNVKGNRADVEWFDGHAVQSTTAKIKPIASIIAGENKLTLVASGAELKLLLAASDHRELLSAEAEVAGSEQ